MNNTNLKSILLEYERTRNKKVMEAFNRKEKIYNENPKLQEIDKKLSQYAISTAKGLLSNNSKDLLDDLNINILKLKQEKESILKSLNIDSSYFEPKYECNICKDTGYITTNSSSKMCNCLKQKLYDLEYNTFNVYNMQNQNFSHFSSTIYSDKVDQERYNSDISPRQNIEIIKKISNNFISNFDSASEKNLLFTGNAGLGKTFISSCIANSLLDNGKTILYQTAPIMLESVINYKLRKINIFNKYI